MCNDLGQKRLALFQPPLHMLRLEYQQIHGEVRRDLAADLECLIKFVPGRHDHQDVHVAVGVRRPVSIGAEENDLVGLEAIGDLSSEPANHAHRNLRAAIIAGRRRLRRGAAFAVHTVILP